MRKKDGSQPADKPAWEKDEEEGVRVSDCP